MLTDDDGQDEVRELLAAWKDFDLLLRMKEGLSDSAWDRLQSALRRCATSWEGSDAIPRLAVSALVDMFAATEANAYLYEAPLQSRVMDIAYELQTLVQECVGIDSREVP